jgi:7,8-dihydropterin-6-yl-methyl-4-(beta-D-ribofuranosyl)aminobenzene 5'-phosphate synthase
MDGQLGLTVLIENDAKAGLASEHGFSVAARLKGGTVIFDTGQSDAVVANARLLGVDIGRITAVVLSHGHYDHVGGLGGCYALSSPPLYVAEGISANALEKVPPEVINVIKEPTEIFPSVIATGPIPRKTVFEPPRADVPEDQALIITAQGKTVLLVGCAHAGAVNTLEYAAEIKGTRAFNLVLGGLHLWAAGNEILRETSESLRRFSIDTLAVGHCTGAQAIEYFKRELSADIIACPAGTVFEL